MSNNRRHTVGAEKLAPLVRLTTVESEEKGIKLLKIYVFEGAYMRQIIITALISLLFPVTSHASQKVTITPFCHSTKTQLAFFTTIDIDINHKGKKSKNRHIYKVNCNLETSACEAVDINLRNLEAGKPLDMLDVILPDTLRVISRSNKEFILEWGVVTLTVDLHGNRVLYRESTSDFENYGVGSCSSDLTIKR